MCTKHPHICSIHCIIPPHMVDAIALRGNIAQKKMAQEIQKGTASFHAQRQQSTPANSFQATQVLHKGAIKDKIADIQIYDAKNTNDHADLPGTLVRQTGDNPVADADVNLAYEGSEDVYKLYLNEYGRDSLDGNGMPMISSVHFGNHYNNAFWDGNQMAYGDGDGILFTSFVHDLTIIGHELSHGVVQHSGGLIYYGQSGALNESFADIFGSLIVQYRKSQQACDASWLVGENSFSPGIHGDALRSLKAPGSAYNDPVLGKDIQPYHMDMYVHTSQDNGGVHINSGIPNHAFYLLSQYLGGSAWGKAGHIWYDALQQINNPFATFIDWADETMIAARNRHGIGSMEEKFVRQAWKMVGVY